MANRGSRDIVSGSDRTLRVFISSTFLDMEADRDELVKFAFPRLRELCESRGVVFKDVDLRWGITDEQKAEARVLPICLAEIRSCRPFFLGLLGERYGWVPDRFEAELVAEEPWLARLAGRSVTELEIFYGVLADPAMAQHAYFYFRDPAYAVSHAGFAELPSLHDVEQLGIAEAGERSQIRRRQLAGLKDQIRDSGLPVREDYATPRALATMVLTDMTAVVDRLFPASSQPSASERERALHEAFLASRVGVYAARHADFECLDAHGIGNGPPLVVIGESGVGKSALLSNWALRWRSGKSGESSVGARAAPVVVHFVAASPASADWVAMVRRLIIELNALFGLNLDVPEDRTTVRAAFAEALSQVAVRGRVVVIIDALNQLDDRDGAPDLVWLPAVVPGNVRLVVSTLPGRCLDELQRRGWPTLTVTPLSREERRWLIAEYLAQYGKSLADPNVLLLANAAQCASPLFLLAALEELRVLGDHDRLHGRLSELLAAAGPRELFKVILSRYEADYERDCPGLVGDAMALLWAGRDGLAEAELLDLVGYGGSRRIDRPRGPTDGAALPQAMWSPLRLAARELLVDHGGLVTFAHEYIRAAIEDRYLPHDMSRRAVHLRLADYFAAEGNLGRRLRELPWQLERAQEWDRLYELLSDLDFTIALEDALSYELRGYWAAVEANSSYRMDDAYEPLLASPGEHDLEAVKSVAQLLADSGRIVEALKLHENLTHRCRQLGDLVGLAASINNQAAILQTLGDLDVAMSLYMEEERISRQLGDQLGTLDPLPASLGNQGSILEMRGDLDKALALYQEQERICRQRGNLYWLHVSLGNQGGIHNTRGELNKAMVLFQQQERICRELGDLEGLQGSLGGQGGILYLRGDLVKARALFDEQERICRQLGDLTRLQLSRGNQGVVLAARGHPEEAMALYREQERICRQLGNLDSLQISLGNQGGALVKCGDLDKATALFREQERICRQLGNLDSLQMSLGNQGVVLAARGDPEEAMALYREQERICRQLGNLDSLQQSLNHQAAILYDRDDLDDAMTLLQEQEQLCRQLGDLDSLQWSLSNQASILEYWDDLDGTISLLKQQQQICREAGMDEALQRSLDRQAGLSGGGKP